MSTPSGCGAAGSGSAVGSRDMKDNSLLMLELAMVMSWELDDCAEKELRDVPRTCGAASWP